MIAAWATVADRVVHQVHTHRRRRRILQNRDRPARRNVVAQKDQGLQHQSELDRCRSSQCRPVVAAKAARQARPSTFQTPTVILSPMSEAETRVCGRSAGVLGMPARAKYPG